MESMEFRTFDTECKDFMKISFVEQDYYCGYFIEHSGFLNPEKYLKWEQYSEKKDKNGKKIFAGDIIHNIQEDCIGEVIFYNGCFQSDCAGWGLRPLYEEDSNNIEIIGNIHENPELLK